MTRKIAFFEGWSWFKFNNLGLALGTNLKFCTRVAKGLKLKVRKFWGLISRFVGEKLVGEPFCPPPLPASWIGLILYLKQQLHITEICAKHNGYHRDFSASSNLGWFYWWKKCQMVSSGAFPQYSQWCFTMWLQRNCYFILLFHWLQIIFNFRASWYCLNLLTDALIAKYLDHDEYRIDLI